MLGEILEYLKNPVTTLIEKSRQEDLKKGGIKLAIISGIMSLIKILTTVKSILSRYSKDSTYASWYSEEQLAEARSEAFEKAELFATFFKTWLIYAAVIAIIAAILYIIAKILKSENDYANDLSMINNVAIICAIANILNIIVSLLYQPLGIIIMFTAVVYASYSLIYAFRDSLGNVDVNRLVLVTTIVIVVFVVLASLIVYNKLENSLGSSLLSITNLLN